MNTYKKISLTLISILNYQSTIFCADYSQMVSQKSDHGISLKAEDFPILLEGFTLCGRYNLQEFFDQQIKEFDTFDNLKNKNTIDQNNEIDREIRIFDILSHAIIPAQNLIIERISINTPLYNKFCKIFNYAIDHDIDLNSQSSSCFAPQVHLDQFFQYCIHTDFMKPTIQKWILTYREHDHNSYSFVERAIELNSAKIMHFLISKDVNITTTDTKRNYKMDDQEYSIQNGKKYYSNNPLCLAILYNANKVITLFIAAKMYPSQTNNQILAKQQIESFNRYSAATSYENNIPLHWAISFHKNIALKALINAGIDINLKDRQGNTPLHLAAQISNNEAISILLDNGADLYKTNNENNSPWDIAKNEKTQNLLKPTNINKKSGLCTIS